MGRATGYVASSGHWGRRGADTGPGTATGRLAAARFVHTVLRLPTYMIGFPSALSVLRRVAISPTTCFGSGA